MGFTGSYNIGGLSGDKGTVGVGNETSVVGIVGNSNGSGQGKTVSGKVSGFSGGYIGSINRDNGTVGVSDEAIERLSSGIGIGVTGITVVTGPCTMSIGVSSVVTVGVSIGGIHTLGGKVGSFGSNDLGGLSWGNCTVGVGDEGGSGGTSHDSKENLKYYFFKCVKIILPLGILYDVYVLIFWHDI